MAAPNKEAGEKTKGAVKKPGAQQQDVLSEVMERKAFLRDGAKTMKLFSLGSLLVLIFSSVVLYASIQKKASNRYIATLPDGQLIQVAPLTMPNHSEAVVKNWLASSLSHTFEMDYVNYKTQISRSVDTYFTRAGGSELVRNLQESGFIDQMVSGTYSVNLLTVGDPVLVRSGNFGQSNFYAWLFQVRGTLTFYSRDGRYDLPVEITVTVTRRDTLEYPVGLGIARIFIELRG